DERQQGEGVEEGKRIGEGAGDREREREQEREREGAGTARRQRERERAASTPRTSGREPARGRAVKARGREPEGEHEENAALAIAGVADRLLVRYNVTNRVDRPISVRLFLAVRPFQVNPPSQALNNAGGAAPIHDIARDGRVVRVDDSLGVVSLAEPSGFGATPFGQGDVVEFLRAGRLPPSSHAGDALGLASGALE